MTNQVSKAQPLYDLIGRIRKPASLRDIMASCVRSVYMGDPFCLADAGLPPIPKTLLDNVLCKQLNIAQVRCLFYLPVEDRVDKSAIVFMHGGGFVFGCTEDVDYICRTLCYQNKTAVVSINYRLAPENPFPDALNDCVSVIQYLVGLPDFEIDKDHIYLAGDSAGGNLAAALSLLLPENGLNPRGLIMLAPWLDAYVEDYGSYDRLAPSGVVYDGPFMAFARAAYAPHQRDWDNPLISPLKSTLSKWPPTMCFVGTDDALCDQVLALKERAAKEGASQIEVFVYEGMPHCFYSLPDMFEEESDCYKRISSFISSCRQNA